MCGLALVAFIIAILFLPKSSQLKIEKRAHLSFKKMSTSGMLRGLFSFRVGMAIGWVSIISFLPIFTTNYMGLSTSLIGILITTPMLTMTALSPLGGIISDKFNRRVLVTLGDLLLFISLVLIPLTNNFWQLLVPCFIGGVAGAFDVDDP